MGEGTRVALLARPGTACERLQAALQEAGADLVLVADPTTSDAAGVIAADVRAVLVALEPQVEEALERFDAVLGDPTITVIFDEAQLAAEREGWDAARWVRHLAAKLGRREDVLPPGAGEDDSEADWSVAVEPAATASDALDVDLSAFDANAEALADLPSDAPTFDALDIETTSFELPALDEVAAPSTGTSQQTADDGLDLDLTAFAAEAESLADAVPGDTIDTGGTSPIGGLQLTDDLSEAMPDLGNFSFDVDLSALDAAIAAPVPERAPPAPAPEPPPPAPASTSTPELTLDSHEAQVDDSGTRDRFHRDLADLEARISGMQLVDEPRARPAQDNGAVLVLAGIGGPDAVRQLLGGLPNGFPRPVLIQQRLDGARHDKLVRQMQRATSLPVHLAEDGMAVEAGNVYILPGDLGLAGGNGLRFGGDATALIPNLPATDSAIVLLSGSDPGVVDAAMAHAVRGTLVVGQSPDGCYDAIAPAELIARGAESGAPPALAKKLAARWTA
jgi:chemosensory pili system protein ChpB (putative protein-glutamate methylesterase)